MIETIDVPNFRKTLEMMAADPELVDMDTWWKTTLCGTTACFAGHAVTLVGDRAEGVGAVGLVMINGNYESVEYIAGNVLGLTTMAQRDAFFYRPAALRGRAAIAVLYQMAEVVTDGEIQMPPEFDADYLAAEELLGTDPAALYLKYVPGYEPATKDDHGDPLDASQSG